MTMVSITAIVLLLVGCTPATPPEMTRPENGPQLSAAAEADTLPPGYTGIRIGGEIQIGPDGAAGDTYPMVMDVPPGSPAEAAGIRAGDTILEVDGVDAAKNGVPLGNPEAGRTYVMRIRRGADEREVKVTAVRRPRK